MYITVHVQYNGSKADPYLPSPTVTGLCAERSCLCCVVRWGDESGDSCMHGPVSVEVPTGLIGTVSLSYFSFFFLFFFLPFFSSCRFN